MKDIVSILKLFFILIIIDIPWLMFRQQYHDTLFYSIQKSKLSVNYLAAVLVYIVLSIALFYGSVEMSSDYLGAGKRGAIIGFIMYLFYDLTNMATISNYTWSMVVADSLWGMVLSGIAAAAYSLWKH
jgi:uncharacterized membrane protein